MHSLLKLSVLIFSLLCPQVSNSALIKDSYKGTWVNIEVIGVDLATAQKIRESIPFQQGDTFLLSDTEKYKSACLNHLKERFPALDASCSFVMYSEKKVFLVVDVHSAESKQRKFRTIPIKNGRIAKIPEKLQELYDSLEERRAFLISQNDFPKEIRNKGYVDYEDPTLHDLAKKISHYAWKHNDALLDIVHYSQDAKERSTAAILFSWARHPENLELILKWNILLDPDRSVRNNAARSYVFVMQDIKNEKLYRKLIPIYCKQATIPSHADRNKALVSILEILKADSKFISSVNNECKSTIKYLGEVSLLSNVGGVAKEIISIIDESENV